MLFFPCLFFQSELMWPMMASNLICSWEWSWTSGPLAFTSQARLQVCGITPASTHLRLSMKIRILWFQLSFNKIMSESKQTGAWDIVLKQDCHHFYIIKWAPKVARSCQHLQWLPELGKGYGRGRRWPWGNRNLTPAFLRNSVTQGTCSSENCNFLSSLSKWPSATHKLAWLPQSQTW